MFNPCVILMLSSEEISMLDGVNGETVTALASVIGGLAGIVGGALAMSFAAQARRDRIEAQALYRETLFAAGSLWPLYELSEVMSSSYSADEQVVQDLVKDMDDRVLLLKVLNTLMQRLDGVVEAGDEAFVDASLSRLAVQAWRTTRPAMERTIEQIDAQWNEMRGYLAAAGLTGAPLRFKATAFFGDEADYRLVEERVRRISDGDGRDDLLGQAMKALRWSKLSKLLETGDVVWESAAAAVSTYVKVSAGIPPGPDGDSELAKHGVTEFKKIVEQVLKRFRRKPKADGRSR
jgi:hypothetical protein